MKQYAEMISKFFSEKITDKAAESLEWFSVILFHAATVPTMLAGLAGLTDNMPPVDIVIMVWTGLLIYFVRSALLKKYLIMITIALGFFAHSILMALMFFR